MRQGKTVRVGTSGWVYRDWRGSVYPPGLPQSSWLHHLSRRFPTIEINASFYRLPSREAFRHWREEVPDGFVFAVKMSRYLTHVRRLRDPGEPVGRFWERATLLREALGPVLFQLPPTLERDVGLLEETLSVLPSRMEAAFEFRHPTWRDDRVHAALDRAGAALVLAHRPRARLVPVVTGGWTYVRFHRGTTLSPSYPAATLRRWADAVLHPGAERAYAYFNNDQGGAAVRDADRFRRLVER